jgi:VWFA-related protein
MRLIGFPKTSYPISIAALTAAILIPALAQKPAAPQNPPKAGTIRVNVGLVQTDVMVFDNQGHFVPDLKMNQFELRIDGKVQPIEFFEMVSAGSTHDEELWAKAGKRFVPASDQTSSKSQNPGRTILIFLDDWHLSADSVMRSRAAVANLIQTSVAPNDKVAIFAASGQLGSAHQLTGERDSLLAVLAKFNFLSKAAEDLSWPPMTENQALMVERQDPDVLLYFVQAILGKPVESLDTAKKTMRAEDAREAEGIRDAVAVTRRRAGALAQLSASIGERTLSAFCNFLKAVETLPGRKFIFYISDGFVLQPQRSDVISRIGELTTSAARAGIVVYTLDARGLVVGLPEAKGKQAPDWSGALLHSGSNEAAAPMDVLNALAADTGGRFMKNTNALDTALITTISEISRYYLLGWSIDPEKLLPGKMSTIKASIKGRSGLSVRVRQGSLDLSKLVQDKK